MTQTFFWNISAVGTTIEISGPAGSVTVNEFADDNDPIQVQAIDVSDHKFDINGKICPFTKWTGYIVTIAVVPTSDSDTVLQNTVVLTRGTAKSYDEKSIRMTISGKNVPNTMTFSDGRIQSGVAGLSASTEGRWKGNVYTFFFGKKE